MSGLESVVQDLCKDAKFRFTQIIRHQKILDYALQSNSEVFIILDITIHIITIFYFILNYTIQKYLSIIILF